MDNDQIKGAIAGQINASFDFRKLLVFFNERRCIGVIEIVNCFPTVRILDAIFDAIVTLRCQPIDRVLSYTGFEFDEDLRRAETASLAERDILDTHSMILFLFDGYDSRM